MSKHHSFHCDENWCKQHQHASEWIWHLPSNLPLNQLTSWLDHYSANKPLHLWLHHSKKQTVQLNGKGINNAYQSTAPGLNNLLLKPHITLSIWLGENTPEWPEVSKQSAYLALDEQLHPLEAIPWLQDKTPPWYAPAPTAPIQHVCVIGAGIAGASTAYALATQGVQVTVMEKDCVAGAASGNRQGLVYAKISPHLTEQSQLLLSGYGFTLRLLQQLLPEKESWNDCGVLHLDVTPQEQKRNQALARWPYPELFTPVSQEEAGSLANVPLPSGGLFWPQGAWVNPPSFIAKLLAHPNIQVLEHCDVKNIEHTDNIWQVHAQHNQQLITHRASHVVLCQGHLSQQFLDLAALPLTPIRGQVTHRPQPTTVPPLKIALSGHSYISPPWQNQYCFGASFQANVVHTELTEKEEKDNLEALTTLCPKLAESFSNNEDMPQGKAAMRCDSHDHLPLVGAIAPRQILQNTYAELAIDKTRPIDTPCQHYPNLYINTAHGTRGLATAPLCGFALAQELLGQSSLLSEPIRRALHPHRFWIRQIIRRELM